MTTKLLPSAAGRRPASSPSPILLIFLLASLPGLAVPVRAQTVECPPEPVLDGRGQLDEAAYRDQLKRCTLERHQQQLQRLKQELGRAPAGLSAAAMETAVLAQDSLALVALYNSTNGPQWAVNTNWLTGPVSTWFGVEVSGDRVTGLELAFINVSGTLPPELGNLTALQRLFIYDNPITGTIPTTLGNLTELQFLEISFTGVTGGIPPELGNLALLQNLNLQDNELTGEIPPELGNLTNLRNLALFDNAPENSAAQNQLSGNIPPELGNLINLEHLEIGRNLLSGPIPTTLGNLTKLKVLELDNNQLSGNIPSELGNLDSLEYLFLYANQLTGSILPALGTLTNLRVLYLNENNFTGIIPSALGNLTNLLGLYLASNQLSGSIPPELGNLASLTDLYLNNNQLTGSIPPVIGNLSALVHLNLSNNQLTGGLPTEITNLSNLYDLYVNSNPLSDPLPLQMQQMPSLEEFYFDNTNLCVPQDPAFLSWLQSRFRVSSSGIACSAPPPPPPPPNALLAYWPFDGATTDAVSGLQAQLFGATFTTGAAGQALHFDGQDDYAAVQNHPNLNPTEGLTLAAWFFVEDGSGNATGLSKRRSYRLLSLQDGSPNTRWVFDFWNQAGTYFRLTARTAVTNGAWHHVAATYDGSRIRLYLDGRLDKAEPATGAVRMASTDFELGRRDLAKYFKGAIDELRLYGRALSLAEIRELYAGGAPAAKAPALTAAVEEVPETYELDGNYPNPFNPQTEIRFGLPEAAEVTLVVYDVVGREVAHLMEGPMEAGYHTLAWQASAMPSGVYLYRLTAGSFTASKTMVLLK